MVSTATLGSSGGVSIKRTRTAATVAPQGPAAADSPSEDHVAAAVRDALAAIGGYRPGELTADRNIREDLGFDSIMVMQFADRIARELRLTGLDPADMHESVTTVGALTVLIQNTVRKVAT